MTDQLMDILTITIKPEEIYINRGGTTKFIAVVTSSSLPLIAKWEKLESGSPRELQIYDAKYFGSICNPARPELVINNIDESDQGVYQITVINSCGSRHSEKAALRLIGVLGNNITLEENNFLRFLKLILDYGTISLRIYFDTLIPPKKLALEINSRRNNFSSWKCTSEQKSILSAVSTGSQSSAAFDTSLLYKLIRNIFSSPPPTQGWDKIPNQGDVSLKDDVERVRQARNFLSHASISSLSDSDFKDNWNDISKAIERLSGGKFKQEMRDLKAKHFDLATRNDVMDWLQKELSVLQQEVLDTKCDLSTTQQEVQQTKSSLTATQQKVQQINSNLTATQQEVQQNKIDLTATRKEVQQTKTDLKATQQKVQQINSNLTATQQEVQQNKIDLTATRKEVHQTKSDLTATQQQVQQTKSDLTATQQEVQQTKSDLTATQQEVLQTKFYLTATKQEVQQTKSDLTATQQEVQQTKSDLTATQQEVQQTKYDLTATQQEVLQTKSDLTATQQQVQQTKSVLKATQKEVHQTKSELTATQQEVQQTKSNMWHRLSSLQQKIETNIPPNIKVQHMTLIEAWREDDRVYYETEYYKPALEKVRSLSHVTFVAGPGSGKTATVRHIALQLEQEGFEIVPISALQKIIDYGHVGRKQVFVFDDVFGIFSIDMNRYNESNYIKDQIMNVLTRGSKLLLTCRKSVYLETLAYNSYITNTNNVFELQNDINNLKKDEKKRILMKHCQNMDIHTESLDKWSFDFPLIMYPLLCKLYSKRSEYQKIGEIFFYNPHHCLYKEFDRLRAENPIHYASLVLCALNNNIISEEILEKEEKQTNEMMKNTLKRCKVKGTTENWEILDALTYVNGTYISKLEKIFTFIHDSIFEMIACHFGSHFPELVLTFMSSSFIHKRVIVNQEKQRDGLNIELKEDNYRLLADRLYTDVISMNLHNVFMNKCLHHTNFCKIFLSVLDEKSDEEINRLFLSLQKESNINVIEKGGEIGTNDKLRSDKDNKSLYVSEENKQLLLLDFRYITDGSYTRPVYSIRVISWVIYYGHIRLLQYLVDRVIMSGQSTDLVFGTTVQEQARLLILGCYCEQLDIVKVIVKYVKPESLNTTPTYDQEYLPVMFCLHKHHTPLTAAVSLQNTNIAKHLITSNCDVNLYNLQKLTSLYISSELGDYDTVRLLITYGAEVNLCNEDNMSPLNIASHHGHSEVVSLLITYKAEVNLCNKHNRSPLYTASHKGHKNVACLLIKHGADVNMCDKEKKTPLYMASQQGHYEVVSLLIAHGADVNVCDDYGTSPLYEALHKGHCDVGNLIITHGAQIDICNADNLSPLHIASSKKYCDVATLLITYGADVNLCDKYNMSPLYIASQKGHCDVATLLLTYGAEVNLCDRYNRSPLYIASRKGRYDMVSLLITHGADVNLCDEDNMSPLYIASYTGHCDVASLLITYEADVNLCDKYNTSPLFMASQNGYYDVASLLITHGAHVNLSNKNNESPLYIVSQEGYCDVASLLITHGADVNLCDQDNKSPLYIASQKGHCDVVSLLITHGADVNLFDENNRSPLYIASQKGHYDVASLLITHGADVNLCDENNTSPLYITSQEGHCDVANLLITHGADANLCDENNTSPLYKASQEGHCDVVGLLITYGAEVNLCNKDNRSPLYKASQQGHCDLASLLITHGAEVNLCDKDNRSPLYIASQEGHCNVASLLITHGAEVNLCDENNTSPLYIASHQGH